MVRVGRQKWRGSKSIRVRCCACATHSTEDVDGSTSLWKIACFTHCAATAPPPIPSSNTVPGVGSANPQGAPRSKASAVLDLQQVNLSENVLDALRALLIKRALQLERLKLRTSAV